MIRSHARGREADPELAQHVLLEPALGQVRASRGRLAGLPQDPHVVGGGALEQREQPLARLPALGLARILGLALELDVRALGEPLERRAEVEPLRLHGEREHVAARAAAEAVVELLDGIDAERRRPLLVERAQAGQPPLAGGLELGAGADELDEVDGVADALARVAGVARHQPARPCGTKRSVQARMAKRSVIPAR